MLSRLAVFLGSFGMVLSAQDAGLVLRTSVSYRTMKASTPLSDSQKAEADALEKAAQQANSAGKYGEALRQFNHGFAVMQGATWTPGLELASSLQAKADHALVETGKPVSITLTPWYPVEKADPLYATVVLHPVMKSDEAGDQTLVTGQPVNAGQLPASVTAKLPSGTAGNYQIWVRLAESKDQPTDKLPPGEVKTIPIHVESLAAEAGELRKRLASVKDRKAPSLPTAEYALALYEKADHGETNPHQYDFHKEFAGAAAILDALDAGRDPWARQKGDLHRAYLSKVDNTLQPYRLFIPDNLDTTKPISLAVALHGMGGDENSLFDAYSNGALKTQAQQRNLMVVCPKGRDSASMYRGSAEQDVLDVLAEVRKFYRIDPDRIYLFGHSMGAYGTWSIAMDHPDLFAGLGLFAGGGNPAGMMKVKDIPQYVVHGDNDKTVPVTQSRAMVEAGRKAGAAIEYVEVPGGSHSGIVVPQFGPMLDFLVKQSRRSIISPSQ